MSFEKEALEFVENLAFAYYAKRDIGILEKYFDERTSFIGTGKDEISRNVTQAVFALQQETNEYSGAFSFETKWMDAVLLSDTICVVYGEITAIPEDTSISDENVRLSIVVEKTKHGIKMVHIHYSHADYIQVSGKHFISKKEKIDADNLREELDLRGRQLENLTKNIPAGAHECANDPNLTLLSMSDGFLSMFGYTREEIKTLFQDRFINMIYPGDRAALLRDIHEQLKVKNELELEYRVLCKNGAPIWILDKSRLFDDGNGNKSFYCILIEISDRKREQEELRLSLERHQVIMNQTTDIIFEWDIRKDTLSFSSNWKKKFGYYAIDKNISNRIPFSENIHPDDISAFIKIMQDTAAGIPYSETEFRIKNSNGRYLWCRIRATTQYDEDKRPIKAVGVIIDIDAETRQKQVLLEQAQRDALTGLYNKTTVNTLIEQKMNGVGLENLQALMIIDVDHFKSVNDTYGHLSGDALLSDVASVLKAHVRSTDLVGRIGGDEFIVYLSELADQDIAQMKAQEILDALQIIVPKQGAMPITCSIGVAVFPKGAVDYYTLCKCADKALYYRKNNGRKGVAFYSPELCDTMLGCDIAQSAVGEVITSEAENSIDERLSQYVFRVLYEATNGEATINRLLEIVGRYYEVSRVYIFESSEDGSCCSNTFEWCEEGIEPQIAMLQNLSYKDDLDDYLKNFNGDGIFSCNDVTQLSPTLYNILSVQNVNALLQCVMLDEGNICGFVGFDACRRNKKWSKNQINSLKLTANVLSTFVVQQRLKAKLKKTK